MLCMLLTGAWGQRKLEAKWVFSLTLHQCLTLCLLCAALRCNRSAEVHRSASCCLSVFSYLVLTGSGKAGGGREVGHSKAVAYLCSCERCWLHLFFQHYVMKWLGIEMGWSSLYLWESNRLRVAGVRYRSNKPLLQIICLYVPSLWRRDMLLRAVPFPPPGIQEEGLHALQPAARPLRHWRGLVQWPGLRVWVCGGVKSTVL